MSNKNSKDTIGNRNRDLPACGEVPQPTAPTDLIRGIFLKTRNIFGSATVDVQGGWEVSSHLEMV